MKIKAVTEAGEKTKDAHSPHLDIISRVTKSTEIQVIPCVSPAVVFILGWDHQGTINRQVTH